jgi:hypothetical protein
MLAVQAAHPDNFFLIYDLTHGIGVKQQRLAQHGMPIPATADCTHRTTEHRASARGNPMLKHLPLVMGKLAGCGHRSTLPTEYTTEKCAKSVANASCGAFPRLKAVKRHKKW